MEWVADLASRGAPFDLLADAHAPFAELAAWPTYAQYTKSLDGIITANGGALTCADNGSKPRRKRRTPPELARTYDGRIYFHGELPTRVASWHDHFNLLAWRAFPRFKAAINAAQVAELVPLFAQPRSQMPGARTLVQDRLAMIDEGGVLVVQAQLAATEQRLLFGHALYEHVLLGRPMPVRGFPLAVTAPPPELQRAPWLAAIDAQLAARLPAILACREIGPALEWPARATP